MHWESHGIETGDPASPFIARITFGTKKRQETLHEWPARSLKTAQQQADDWLKEYVARLGLGDDEVRDLQVMQGRWARLEKAAWLPELPEPSEKYCRALEAGAAPDLEIEPASRQTSRSRTRPQYATQTKIRSVVASARAAGIDVAGIRAWPDGSVAAFDQRLAFATWPAKEPEGEVNTADWFDPT